MPKIEVYNPTHTPVTVDGVTIEVLGREHVEQTDAVDREVEMRHLVVVSASQTEPVVQSEDDGAAKSKPRKPKQTASRTGDTSSDESPQVAAVTDVSEKE